MFFRIFRYFLPKNQFGKGVLTLITGTGFAQVLPIALSPILTRLYTPEDFGVFALYASVLAIIMVLVTCKYELAIIVPKRDIEAINLVAVTAGLSLLTSLALLGLVMAFDEWIVLLLNNADIGLWLYAIPLATLIVGCYHALNFWANRRTRYKDMAISRVIQSGVSGTVQLAGGLLKMGIIGLVLGQMIGQLLSTVVLVQSITGDERSLLRRISLKRMLCVARKYIGYPKYISPSQLMSVGSAELPLLLLTIFFGPTIAGFYSLAQRVMTAPLSLVANAIGDVYRQKAAEDYAKNGDCRNIFFGSIKRLLVFAVFPTLPVLLFGPSLFAFIFGDSWRTAGEIASVLSVLIFFQTVSSPLSSTVLLHGWLRLELSWQLSRLCLAALVFYLCHRAETGYQIAIIAHVFAFSCMYVLHTYFQYKAAHGKAQFRNQ